MKKVGIVTFHAANNFGAVLQCYALEHFIEQMGFIAEIIDYRPKSLTTEYKAIIRHPIKFIKSKGFFSGIKRFFNIRLMFEINKRNRKFVHFRKHNLKTSRRVHFSSEALKKNPPIYDYYIAGSDQIWNPYLPNGLDEAFFLSFSPVEKRRIAYGVSIGQTKDIGDETADKFEVYVQHFDYISTREKTAAGFLKKISSKKIVTVLDPVLLLDAQEWDRIIISPKVNQKYLFIYNLQPNKQIIDFANQISENYNLKVVCFRKDGLENVIDSFMFSSPGEFLGLLKNSEMVITNSFHGTVFSILYHKPFYTFPHTTRGERMLDLLNTLGLQDRILYKPIDEVDFIINYEQVEGKLSVEREKSLDFLREVLGDASGE